MASRRNGKTGRADDAAQPLTLRSRRSLTLRFNIAISKTRRFWEALEEGRIETTKCGDCGELSFPPQADCPRCDGANVDWVDLGTDAELLTYTLVQFTPGSFVESDPYIVAIGRMKRDGEGPNILAWLEGAVIGDLRPGTKLKLEVRKRDDDGAGGSPYYYVFVPASPPPPPPVVPSPS